MSPTQADLEALATRVGEHLLARGEWLITAESCTGGWVAQTLTAVAGSSHWFDRGFITYSNHAKMDELQVPRAVLESHGAVSEATAQAMARGALGHGRAHWTLAITGIAGPTGGSPEKPVGTVCFAWAMREGPVDSETARLSGDRESVRAQAVAHALTGLLARIRNTTALV